MLRSYSRTVVSGRVVDDSMLALDVVAARGGEGGRDVGSRRARMDAGGEVGRLFVGEWCV